METQFLAWNSFLAGILLNFHQNTYEIKEKVKKKIKHRVDFGAM